LPAWCTWQNLLLKPALSHVIAFVPKAIETAFFKCRLRTHNVSHKNVQKGALFVIYAPKMFSKFAFSGKFVNGN
jgi:hypothetical protein